MKLNEATYFPDAKELTRHGFVSHMEDFIGKLIGDNPLGADVDDYLKDFDIDSQKALEMLTKPEVADNPDTAVIIRTERIKNGGTDENGRPRKDAFQVIYKVPKRDPERGIKGVDEKLRNLYIKTYENHIIPGTVLNEDDGGMAAGPGAEACNNSAPIVPLGRKTTGDAKKDEENQFPVMRRPISTYTNESKKKMKRPIGRLTMFITEEQMKQLEKLLREEEDFGGGALTANNVGVDGPDDWTYDVPFGAKSKNDPAMDRKNILSRKSKANQPVGHIGESKSGIHIDPENKGKFNATKKRTGKTTEELTHSKNPLTRKRAQFALNAAKWNKK